MDKKPYRGRAVRPEIDHRRPRHGQKKQPEPDIGSSIAAANMSFQRLFTGDYGGIERYLLQIFRIGEYIEGGGSICGYGSIGWSKRGRPPLGGKNALSDSPAGTVRDSPTPVIVLPLCPRNIKKVGAQQVLVLATKATAGSDRLPMDIQHGRLVVLNCSNVPQAGSGSVHKWSGITFIRRSGGIEETLDYLKESEAWPVFLNHVFGPYDPKS